jgi:hypothetical protein
VSAWRCKQVGEDGAHPDLDIEVSLRQLPAVSDLWIEPKNGVLVMRLMTAQMSDAVLGNAFTFFYKLSPEQVAHLCPDCGRVLP